jgi:3-phosphoshikimate 1-carboxyvinyltransferase
MKKSFSKIKSVKGELSFAGDKSISHRAIFFASMADGKSKIKNISLSKDVKSTQNVFRELGLEFSFDATELIVIGRGKKNFLAPQKELDCGNSGTTARLISGLLVAQNFSSIIIGDESLSRRPMQRIIEPLKMMGAEIESSNSTLPIKILPAKRLTSIEYELKIPSAQVKSCIIMAALNISDETKISEKFITRDHTERMLELPVVMKDNKKIISASEKFYPQPKEYFIPGDISSAAFFIVLALLSDNSELLVKNVSLNPTRTGFLDLLKKMNASIQIQDTKYSSNEPYGDILIKSSDLKNIKIDESLIPNIIDEIPILTVAGIFAEGNFEIRNCKELRYKESDRIKSICDNLRLTGLDIVEYDDGFRVEGRIKNKAVTFNSFNDHRIAMAFSVLAILMRNNSSVDGIECVGISNPHFYQQLENISVT